MSGIDNIWYTRCPVPTASGVSLARGELAQVFSELGVKLTDLATSDDAETRRSHFSHTVENSIRQGGNIPPLVARSRGADVVALGFSWPTISHRILVDSDSQIVDVEDLRGKRLGIPLRADDELDFWRPTVLRGFEAGLQKAGLTFADVELVDVAVPGRFRENKSVQSHPGLARSAVDEVGFQRQEAAALLRGEVDAIFSENASNALIRHVLGLRPIIELAPEGEQPAINNGIPTVLTASGALVDDHPELVRGWIDELLRVPQWIRDNRDRARRIVALEAGLPEDLVDEAFPGDLATQVALDADDVSVKALAAQNEFLAQNGFVAAPSDLDGFLRLDLLREALVEFGGQL